jgi:hypothetical protein
MTSVCTKAAQVFGVAMAANALIVPAERLLGWGSSRESAYPGACYEILLLRRMVRIKAVRTFWILAI